MKQSKYWNAHCMCCLQYPLQTKGAAAAYVSQDPSESLPTAVENEDPREGRRSEIVSGALV